MYRTNHFDAGNFSFFYLGNPQSQVRKVHAGACADLRAFLIHFLHQYVKEGVILIRAGNVQPEETVDLSDFLRGPEHGFIRLVKRREEEFPRGEQDRNGDHAEQAVQR